MQPDGTMTLFDDGGGPPRVEKYSRGLRLSLNTKKMTASVVRSYPHPPPIASAFEGGEQALSGGDTFVGWGQQPYFTEFNSSGQATFDAHFTAPSGSYRAYRFNWSGQPSRPPALAGAAGSDGTVKLWASWNGATTVSSWRVLGRPVTDEAAQHRHRAQDGVRDHDHRPQRQPLLRRAGAGLQGPGAVELEHRDDRRAPGDLRAERVRAQQRTGGPAGGLLQDRLPASW